MEYVWIRDGILCEQLRNYEMWRPWHCDGQDRSNSEQLQCWWLRFAVRACVWPCTVLCCCCLNIRSLTTQYLRRHVDVGFRWSRLLISILCCCAGCRCRRAWLHYRSSCLLIESFYASLYSWFFSNQRCRQLVKQAEHVVTIACIIQYLELSCCPAPVSLPGVRQWGARIWLRIHDV